MESEYLKQRRESKLQDKKSYKEVRSAYMKKHPKCEVCKRNNATEIHHIAGRIGNKLTDINNFMSVCRSCHREIHDNDIWARLNGYLKSKFDVNNTK